MRCSPGVVLIAALLAASPAIAQTPQPFPRPGSDARDAPARPQAPPPAPASTAAPTRQPAPPPAASITETQQTTPTDPSAPTAATLGIPLYPTARFIASYDAGRGQRYYIFGTTAPYAELVTYYKSVLRERGDEVFEQPPTYMFQVGRFRDETMAFPPGVTVKDWTWGGSQGYLDSKASGPPTRFPTILMIVPPPPTTPAR